MSCSGEFCTARTPTCRPGSACFLVASWYDDTVELACEDAYCQMECDDGEGCSIDCTGESICELTCSRFSPCSIDCGDDAKCMIRGGGATYSNCANPQTCADRWIACNQPCP
jgi:hypothetical protein